MSVIVGALCTRRFGRRAFAVWIAYEVIGAVAFYGGGGAIAYNLFN